MKAPRRIRLGLTSFGRSMAAPTVLDRRPSLPVRQLLFGYPHVPMIAGMAITVQRGEVVNPEVETPATAEHGRRRPSCTRRSRDPATAADRSSRTTAALFVAGGRGQLALDERPRRRLRPPQPRSPRERIDRLDREVEELKAKAFAPAFYRGIPSSEVIRALDYLGFGGLAKLDEPPAGGTSVQFRSA